MTYAAITALSPADAAELCLKWVNLKPDEKLSKPELAAWTMICNQLMNLGRSPQ
jgi:hypothetical protein